MTHPSKRKGNEFERELVRLAQESGLVAKRAYGSNGEALGMHASVDVIIDRFRVQAKRRAKLAAFLRVPEECDVVVTRCDHGESVVMMSLWTFFDLVKGSK